MPGPTCDETEVERVGKAGLLRPGPPRGWGWVRLSTATSVLMLVTTAAVAVVGFWLKAADKHPRTVATLLVVSGSLTVAGMLAAVAGRWAELRTQRTAADAQWRDTVAAQLLVRPSGNLPQLSHLPDSAFGPTPTRYTREDHAPYVDRPAVDGRVREAIGAGGPPYPFVVVWGASKAGKSRTVVQAARAVFKDTDPLIVLAHDRQSLAQLTRLDPPLPIDPQPALVWLDDLTAADLAVLTSTVLDWWLQRAVIVATMTADRYRQVLYSGNEVTATARTALHGLQQSSNPSS